LESTSRYSNNEDTPLTHPYNCKYQGIEAGWGDDYIAGIECQWIDITSVDTSKKSVLDNLSFVSNNDQFLCEGSPILDAQGQYTFVPTVFKTASGATVDRIACNFGADWNINNEHTTSVEIPLSGSSYVTKDCKRGQDGAVRNCGLQYQGSLQSCTPGSTVKLSCSIANTSTPQVLRICEGSSVLNTGTACTFRESRVNTTIEGSNTIVNFTCPTARDTFEIGGKYSIYTAPVHVGDLKEPVQCNKVN
jgi:hypothetical protein